MRSSRRARRWGRFADFDALVAAPGVPVAALEKRRDALFF